MDLKLNSDEIDILKVILNQLAVKKRTGELGIIHGSQRFVSTNTVFKKQHLELLDKLALKTGLNSIKRV